MSYKAFVKQVKGNKTCDLFLYTLSTCGWCQMTKKLLNDLGAEYTYVDVDLLNDKDKKEAEKDIMKWRNDVSFPTIIVDNKKCIQGFDEDAIRKTVNVKKTVTKKVTKKRKTTKKK